MNENEARRLARRLTDLLGSPIQHIMPEKLKFPVTLAEILMLGFQITVSLRKAHPDAPPGGFPISDEFLVAMYKYPESPGAVEELLYKGLLASQENPIDVDASLDVITTGKMRQELRKELRDVFDTTFPPGPPGKSPTITREDLPRFFERSERYRPLFFQFLELGDKYPNRTPEDVIAFLKPDYPEECSHIAPRVTKLMAEVAECAAYDKAKTIRGKASILADVMAGTDFGLSPSYALQQAQIARRMVLGKQRSRKPRLKKSDVAQVLGEFQHNSNQLPAGKRETMPSDSL